MKIYELIYPDLEDDRVCTDISDSACNDAPKNYFWNTTSGAFSKLAEQLASPSTVLTWAMASLGASPFLIGLLQPIKEAGSMLPQLFISAKIRSFKLRKYIWAAAAVTQSLALLFMGLGLIFFPETLSVSTILVGLLIFSICSGMASVSFKDVLAKTIPKGTRGKLLASRATIGGILSLMAATVIHFYFDEDSSGHSFSTLIFIASLFWLFSAFSFLQIDELKGETKGGRDAFKELKNALTILKKDRGFLLFLISRTFLLSVTLSIPFYSIHARELSGEGLTGLGALIFSLSLAQIFSSPFWGHFSDKSGKTVMIYNGLIAASAAALAMALSFLSLSASVNTLIYFFIFFILGMAQAGARIGRKTYLVDYAPKNERPLYVAIANTWMGLATILGVGLGLIATYVEMNQLIFIIMLLNLSGSVYAYFMREI